MERLWERLIQAAGSLPLLELAVLFGSAGRGESTAGSDLDLGVRLVEDSPKSRREVEIALGRAAGREVDVVYLDQAPPQLRFEIARDGQLLLERKPYAWADFRARAMVDWWDWAPTARKIHAAAARRLRERLEHGSS